MKKIILLGLILVVVLSLIFAGCSLGVNPNQAMAGQWVLTDGDAFVSRFEIFTDGTYTSSHTNYEGRVSVDNNRIRFSGVLVDDKIYTYKLNGDTLEFLSDDGVSQIAVYKRK